jgi:hypothetical protein
MRSNAELRAHKEALPKNFFIQLDLMINKMVAIFRLDFFSIEVRDQF